MKKWMRVFTALCVACLVATCLGCSSPSGDAADSTADDAASSESAEPASEVSGASAQPAPEASSEGQGGMEDGAYDIEAETDSSMFHVDACVLTVEGGQMTATMTMPGEGFSRVFYGTSEEAESADDSVIYDYTLDDQGKYTFTIPVPALEEEMPIAAWGQRRDRWYDHTIIFHAPAGMDVAAGGDMAAPAAVDGEALAEGEYLIDVTMEGGTGKATIASPAKLAMAEDGSMTATIVWSSSNYDQMVIDGVQYLPTTIEGGSTFEIPVAALDEDLPVQAETTAMSEPHMIDYTLRFDSGSMHQ